MTRLNGYDIIKCMELKHRQTAAVLGVTDRAIYAKYGKDRLTADDLERLIKEEQKKVDDMRQRLKLVLDGTL